MKAIICKGYGREENLVLANVPKPAPKKNEVLIRIKATSVTTSDVLIRKLNEPVLTRLLLQVAFGFGKPRNPVLGMVSAGTVESVGKNVTAFKVGDEVFAYGSMSATKRRFGSYAEYICLPENWNIAHKPRNLSFQESAAIPYGGLLASHLIQQIAISPKDSILIYGASGSIGTMAIQLAKNAGAYVTSVCSSRNIELVTDLGSHEAIDYSMPNAELKLKKYKYVIDAVGNSKTSVLKEKSKSALLKNGKYISIDDGIPLTPKSAFLNLKTLAEEKKIKPVIDREYPLEQLADAHRYVEKGHKSGNVIINVQ